MEEVFLLIPKIRRTACKIVDGGVYAGDGC